MKDYDGADLNNLFNADSADEFLKALENLKEEIKSIEKLIIYDSISTPVGNYVIMTTPDPIEGGHFTIIAVERTGTTIAGPIEVENYNTRFESEKGHIAWRKMILDSPPLILKDIKTTKSLIFP